MRRGQRGHLPDVINIGGQKCGTTSLYYYLRVHPEIASCRFKETRFFARGRGSRPGGDHRLNAEGNWHRGVAWYRAQFPRRAPVIFEGFGLAYTDWPFETGVPERIASLIPDARFIYLVREPVARALSHWRHAYADSLEDRPVDMALLAGIDDPMENPYVRRSLFGMQLEQYRKVFDDPSRFLVMEDRDLLERRVEALAGVFRFLGVDPDYRSPEHQILRHPSSRKRRNTRLGMLIQDTIGDRIYRRLRGHHRHWFKTIVYGPFSQLIDRPVIGPETRAALQERFAPDVRRLEELTGQSFGHWLSPRGDGAASPASDGCAREPAPGP